MSDSLKEFENLKSKFSKKKIEEGKLERFARQIAFLYGIEGNKKMCLQYSKLISNADLKAGLFNEIAWALSGESLSIEGKYLEFAQTISKMSLDLLTQEKINRKGKPVYFTNTEWNKEMDEAYAAYADTYALVAHKLGDHKEALKYQTIAVKGLNFEDVEMNSRYAVFKEKLEGEIAVLPFLEKAISDGKASNEMKDQFSRIFIKNLEKEEAARMYLASLEKEAKQKHNEMLRSSMFEGNKRPFSLVNLEGEEVSLHNLKGKIVVIKFWAIWCEPCKKSFPGMQKMVDKYAADDNVEFLFVNTWGTKENNEELVRQFIKENNYDLQVLLDSQQLVLNQYDLNSVPSRFVLDQSGQIRFKDDGFSNTQELVHDLTIIIDELTREIN